MRSCSARFFVTGVLALGCLSLPLAAPTATSGAEKKAPAEKPPEKKGQKPSEKEGPPQASSPSAGNRSPFDLEAWGTIKPIKDTDFWEFAHIEVDEKTRRAKKITALVRIPEDVTYYQDKPIPMADLEADAKLWIFARRFEQEAPSSTGYMGTDRQMKNCSGIFLGEALTVNASFKNPQDPESRWYQVTVAEPGASISVSFDSLSYKVVLLRTAPVVKREKLDATPKLKSGLRVALGLEKSDERPEGKLPSSIKADTQSYVAKAVFILDPRLMGNFYPMIYR